MKYPTALKVLSIVQAQRVDLRVLMMRKILERGKLVTLQGFLSRRAFVRKEVNITYN